MKTLTYARTGLATLTIALIAAAAPTIAQTPVDESGQPLGTYSEELGNEEIPLMANADLEELVGPIALYPDDLLAIVLPATAYPLQIMEAERFLAELEDDASLKPDPEWDDSVVALLNYPEIVELLNEDMDWTWRLGEAVVAQQGDVVTAIESFRDRAYAAGNLKTDEYQTVSRTDGHIEITPVSEEVIYVPYYEPERVVVYQPRPVYYYYPRSYPVYYYPYSSAYNFNRGYFWGVTTAFTIGWLTDSLHVYHHSYHGHPYYGRAYRDRWYYRRPTINVYNTTYVRNTNVTVNRYYHGDVWRPRHDRRDYVRNNRVDRVIRNRPAQRRQNAYSTRTLTTGTRATGTRATRNQATRNQVTRRQEPIRFRERSADERRQARATLTRQQQAGKAARKGSVEPRRQVQPTRREQHRAPVVRQDREARGEPVVRQSREQQTRKPAVRTTREQRREPVVRESREQRRQPVVRQSREQRSEPVARQRPQKVAVQRQERRQPAARPPAQRESKPVAQTEAKRQKPRRSESRSEPRSSKSERKDRRSARR